SLIRFDCETAGDFSFFSCVVEKGRRFKSNMAATVPQAWAVMHHGQKRFSTKACSATNHNAAPIIISAPGARICHALRRCGGVDLGAQAKDVSNSVRSSKSASALTGTFNT